MGHKHENNYQHPFRCGECPLLLHADASGAGLCDIRHERAFTDGACKFTWQWPSRAEAIRLLHLYQKWRRGGKGKMLPPFLTGKAIDAAIRFLREQEHNK